MLGSMFQIDATARPGHTAEELEKAIDEELAALRAQPPRPREVERARNTIETSIIGGLERLGGFGGVADRLNSYNHYLGTPDYLQKDIQRYRAVTPAAVQAFVREQLARIGARRAARRARAASRRPAAAPATPPRPAARAPAGRRRVDQRRRALADRDAEGRARRSRCSCPTPATATLSNGLTLILSERRGLPIVAGEPRAQDRQRRQPGRQARPRQLRGRDARRRHRDAQCAADRRRGRAARRARSRRAARWMRRRCRRARWPRTFPRRWTWSPTSLCSPSFPAEEIERQRAARLGQLVQQRDNPAPLPARWPRLRCMANAIPTATARSAPRRRSRR